jgi:hypothetical protein
MNVDVLFLAAFLSDHDGSSHSGSCLDFPSRIFHKR